MSRRDCSSVRVTVRVYPASKRAGVGGRYGSSEPPVLMVRVTAPAADGKANEAVLESVATAFRIPRRSARLVAGTRDRTKIIELDEADPRILAALLAAPEK
jgi:uncharacterized protein YggU (UPF0235/DUF167 family)